MPAFIGDPRRLLGEAEDGQDAAELRAGSEHNGAVLVKGNSKFAGPRHFDTIVETINSFSDLIPTGLHGSIKGTLL